MTISVGPFKRIVGVYWPNPDPPPVVPDWISFGYVTAGSFIASVGGFGSVVAFSGTTGFYRYTKFKDGREADEYFGTAELLTPPTPPSVPLIADDDPEWTLINNPNLPVGHYDRSFTGATEIYNTWRGQKYSPFTQEPYQSVPIGWANSTWSIPAIGANPVSPVQWRNLRSDYWVLQVTAQTQYP